MISGDSLVDRECSLNNVEVLTDKNNKPYGCTLNFVNIKINNNKFYILQILYQKTDNCHYLYSRWGRNGEKDNKV